MPPTCSQVPWGSDRFPGPRLRASGFAHLPGARSERLRPPHRVGGSVRAAKIEPVSPIGVRLARDGRGGSRRRERPERSVGSAGTTSDGGPERSASAPPGSGGGERSSCRPNKSRPGSDCQAHGDVAGGDSPASRIRWSSNGTARNGSALKLRLSPRGRREGRGRATLSFRQEAAGRSCPSRTVPLGTCSPPPTPVAPATPRARLERTDRALPSFRRS